MFLQKLSLINFKNYQQADIEFSSKLNCFIGKNGVGKTNIFDAVYYSVVTMSTVGFGDITPVSDAGRIVTITMIASAIILIPWQISVFLKRIIRTATKVKVTCRNCGLQHHDRGATYCKDCGHTLFNPDKKE